MNDLTARVATGHDDFPPACREPKGPFWTDLDHEKSVILSTAVQTISNIDKNKHKPT